MLQKCTLWAGSHVTLDRQPGCDFKRVIFTFPAGRDFKRVVFTFPSGKNENRHRQPEQ